MGRKDPSKPKTINTEIICLDSIFLVFDEYLVQIQQRVSLITGNLSLKVNVGFALRLRQCQLWLMKDSIQILCLNAALFLF